MLEVAQKQVQVPVTSSPDEAASVFASESRQTAQFALTLTAAFFALSWLGIANHEILSDEYRAWEIARSSVDIPQLLHTASLGDSSALWHLCLWIITAFTNQPFAMQMIHLTLASGAIFLMARFSPFTPVQKILLAFGYFPFYAYGIVSQGYGLSSLILFATAAACSRFRRYKFLVILLPLLASTTVFGAAANYYGQLFMLLIAVLWMAIDYQKTQSQKSVLQSKPAASVLVALLFIHFMVGQYFYFRDLRQQLSPIKRVAEYIKRHDLNETPMFVVPDVCASGFTTFAEEPVYSLSNRRRLRFGRLDTPDNKCCDWCAVAILAVNHAQKWQQPVLVLSDRRLTGMPASFPFKEIRRFPDKDESRFLYVARPTNEWLQKHFTENAIRRIK